jgi:Ca2+-binding EF-hand superfamily protein
MDRSTDADGWKMILCICIFALCSTFGTMAYSVQKSEKSLPKKERQIALGENEVKQLLTLMDADKNGRIFKQEFMNFMAAEFDRLDTDKSGELDVKELTKSQLRASRGALGK